MYIYIDLIISLLLITTYHFSYRNFLTTRACPRNRVYVKLLSAYKLSTRYSKNIDWFPFAIHNTSLFHRNNYSITFLDQIFVQIFLEQFLTPCTKRVYYAAHDCQHEVIYQTWRKHDRSIPAFFWLLQMSITLRNKKNHIFISREQNYIWCIDIFNIIIINLNYFSLLFIYYIRLISIF